MNWKTYTIDDFISFSYPSDWHFQNNGQIMLSGVQNLFLISDYGGNLSTQDRSSESQKFLIEGTKISKNKEESLEEFAKPDISQCDDGSCTIKISNTKKDGHNTLKLFQSAVGTSFYKNEYYLYVEGDESLYEIHVSFFDAREDFSNLLRQKIIDKIANSIVIKGK